MKNKSIIMKILVVGSMILVLLLFVVIFSLIKLFIPTKTKSVEKKIISNTYDLSNIESISFNFKNANSKFELIEGNEMIITQNSKEEKFHLNVKDKVDKYFFEEDSYIINPQKKNYIVQIPSNYLGTINIINGFGKISYVGIPNDLFINNNAGSIDLKELKNLQIKDVSGNISIDGIEGSFKAESSTGNITIKNFSGISNIESITGDIKITNFNILGESYIENVSGDIIMDINDDSLCTIEYSNERGKTKISDNICDEKFGIYLLNIKNITGEIKIY